MVKAREEKNDFLGVTWLLPGGPEAPLNEDLAYFSGSLVDKLVTALQVFVSHLFFLGVVGHLLSLSVRTSGFAVCR